MSRRSRNRKGSAISEFGPALWIFLILIFFPLMDMLAITLQYCCGWYMNFCLTREACVRKSTEEDQVKTDVNNQINNAAPGIRAFIGLENEPILESTITYESTVNGVPGNLRCTTPIVGRPFLPIPVPGITAPGLNAPFNISISSERPREVTQ